MTEPAWRSSQRSGGNTYGPASQQPRNDDETNGEYPRYSYNSVQQFVSTVKSFSYRDGRLRRMPITTNNELPHLAFPIGANKDKASISALYDTGGALNTGSLHYHRDVIKKNYLKLCTHTNALMERIHSIQSNFQEQCWKQMNHLW